MKEASRWRYGLAQQIAPQYGAHPEVAAVLLEGSVARDEADRFSDIDLAVVWRQPPTAQEERALATRALRRGHVAGLAPRAAAAGWAERSEIAGVPIDVRHTTVAATEALLAAVLEHADPSLVKQQQVAALRSALPLFNPPLLTTWQQQAAAYPRDLAVAMVRRHLCFPPACEQEQLARRGEVLVLYDALCRLQKRLWLVLLGLSRLYYPGWRWLDRLLETMPVAPSALAPRFKQLFAIVSIDPLASVYQLHDLIEETFVLVETHLAPVDTRPARERFREQRVGWDHALDGLG